jgi:DNA-binding LacI/PurR family transcriptional regulator
MKPYRNQTVPEQVAVHLRQEIADGRLEGVMPGVLRLEAELGVNRKTVEAALRMMEKEGLLIPQGAGKRRSIVRMGEMEKTKKLRVAIILYCKDDLHESYIVDLRHKLQEAGHTAFHPSKTLMDLHMEAGRVARMVGETVADAWVVCGGSREVLEWFASRNLPVMALFGRRRRLPIASVGPDKIPAYRELTRTLISLGHRRIVFMAWRAIREPVPSIPLQAFLDELAAAGIQPGPYHLPDWKETVEGFYECLDSLFRLTPPTALIVDGIQFWLATQQFLAAKKLRQPQDLSVVCTDGIPDFAWCRPMISHIRWDSGPVVNRIVRWANHLNQGKPDLRQTSTAAEFVYGGTIGPAKGG